jgi:hypothetical protein
MLVKGSFAFLPHRESTAIGKMGKTAFRKTPRTRQPETVQQKARGADAKLATDSKKLAR